MGRSLAPFNEAKVAERWARGFGQGTGATYKPWLSFRDLSSRGVTTRLRSPKLLRTLTVFSNVEKCAYLLSERLKTFSDYREQGPMDREITQEIAKDLGIRHPQYFGTRVPAVLTYDALLVQDGQVTMIDCKHSEYEKNYREQEAYAIRDVYAARMGWAIKRLTDESYTRQRIHNLQWIRLSVVGKGRYALPATEIDAWGRNVLDHLGNAIDRGERSPLRPYLRAFDEKYHLKQGLGLLSLRRLLWHRHLKFDLDTHFDWLLAGPVDFLRVDPNPLSKQPPVLA